MSFHSPMPASAVSHGPWVSPRHHPVLKLWTHYVYLSDWLASGEYTLATKCDFDRAADIRLQRRNWEITRCLLHVAGSASGFPALIKSFTHCSRQSCVGQQMDLDKLAQSVKVDSAFWSGTTLRNPSLDVGRLSETLLTTSAISCLELLAALLFAMPASSSGQKICLIMLTSAEV